LDGKNDELLENSGGGLPHQIDFPTDPSYPYIRMLVRIIKTVLSALSASGLGIFLV
jgi:hypothetical protein